MMSFKLFKIRSLSKEDESALFAQHESETQQLLPILGPLFGAAVILFCVWDYLIDPAHTPMTFWVRVGFVLAGSIAYLPTRLPWTPAQRWGIVYGTHASAIIVAQFLLKDGFVYGLAGIVACVFAVSVVTLRIRTFLSILAVPSLLFVVLNTIASPFFDYINNLMLYVFAVVLAGIVMLVLRYFREKAFLFEKELLRISRHDSLTNAYNRGYLTELAEREIALAKRHNRPLAIAMLDIDRFKQINDTYGHAVGDEVIKQLVRTCTENLRVIDHFGRIGGEEFVCVLPESDESEAMVCAERLRRSIEAIRLQVPEGQLQFTVSIGVAVLDASHSEWSTLLKDADTALYRAKEQGRNRIVKLPVHPV